MSTGSAIDHPQQSSGTDSKSVALSPSTNSWVRACHWGWLAEATFLEEPAGEAEAIRVQGWEG